MSYHPTITSYRVLPPRMRIIYPEDSSLSPAERVLVGQAGARAAGKTWGGSEKGRRLKVTAEQVATIQKMKRDGAKIAAIPRATSLSRQTVYQYLPGNVSA